MVQSPIGLTSKVPEHLTKLPTQDSWVASWVPRTLHTRVRLVAWNNPFCESIRGWGDTGAGRKPFTNLRIYIHFKMDF